MISNKHATSPKREDEWGPYLYTDLYIYGKYIVIKRSGWTDTILFRKICEIGDHSRQWIFKKQWRSHFFTHTHTHKCWKKHTKWYLHRIYLFFWHLKISPRGIFTDSRKGSKKPRHDNNPNHRMALRSPNWPNLVNSSKSVSLIRGEDLWSWNC